jgi:hypothetical protein
LGSDVFPKNSSVIYLWSSQDETSGTAILVKMARNHTGCLITFGATDAEPLFERVLQDAPVKLDEAVPVVRAVQHLRAFLLARNQAINVTLVVLVEAFHDFLKYE